MKSLTKKQLQARDTLVASLEKAKTELEKAHSIYKANPEDEMWMQVEEYMKQYNNVIESAEEFRQEIHDGMEFYFDGKSEGWQDSEKGDLFGEWMEQWDSEFETIGPLEKDEDLDLEDIAGLLADMPAKLED